MALAKIHHEPAAEQRAATDVAAGLLAAGGIAAAFGAAACCALPAALGWLGVSSIWLGGLALFATPYRPELLAGAVLCLVGGGALLWRRARAACSAPGAACRRPANTTALAAALSLGAALTALGFIFG